MDSKEFFQKAETTDYTEYCSKKDLEGLVFTITDYVLIPDKKQYNGDLADTYEVTVSIDIDGTQTARKFDVAYSVSRSGKVNAMFAMFHAADNADHFIPADKMTMFKNVYKGGYSWKLTPAN